MKSAFFSVVLPTFNRAHFVADAVASVLKQTEQDLELIIIDDASTDKTGDVLKQFLPDRRVRVLQNVANLERSASRNRGVDVAKGQYIAFLDSDDVYLPEHLAILRKKIAEEGQAIALFYTGYRREFLMTGRAQEVRASARPRPVESVLENHMPIITVAVHRSIFDAIRFDERMSLWEDVQLIARVAMRYPLIPCSAVTAVWRTHGANTEHLLPDAAKAAMNALETVLMTGDVRSLVSRSAERRLRSGLLSACVDANIERGRRLAATCNLIEMAGQCRDWRAVGSRLAALAYSCPGGSSLRRMVALRHRKRETE